MMRNRLAVQHLLFPALLLAAACESFRSECTQWRNQQVSVPYCQVFRGGYCQVTGYRLQTQAFCVSRVCRPGYVSFDGDCLTRDEVEGRERRRAGEDAARNAAAREAEARREAERAAAPPPAARIPADVNMRRNLY